MVQQRYHRGRAKHLVTVPPEQVHRVGADCYSKVEPLITKTGMKILGVPVFHILVGLWEQRGVINFKGILRLSIELSANLLCWIKLIAKEWYSKSTRLGPAAQAGCAEATAKSKSPTVDQIRRCLAIMARPKNSYTHSIAG